LNGEGRAMSAAATWIIRFATLIALVVASYPAIAAPLPECCRRAGSQTCCKQDCCPPATHSNPNGARTIAAQQSLQVTPTSVAVEIGRQRYSEPVLPTANGAFPKTQTEHSHAPDRPPDLGRAPPAS
jgi:hypothetical protein